MIFAFLPVGFAIGSQLEYMLGDWTVVLMIRIGLVVGMVFLPLIAIFFREDLWQSIERTGYVPLVWVISLAVGLRLVLLPLLSTNFTSDMMDVHLFAVDVVSGHPFANLEQYQGIPRALHLSMTGLLTSVVYRIFGASFATAKAFMLVLAALTVWLIYLVGKQLAGARVGLVAASLYGTLPALICYTGVLSGEHIGLLMITLSILLYARLKTSDENRYLFYAAGYVLCGLTIGLIDWFRPGGIILVTALTIADLIYWTRDRILSRRLLPLGLLIFSYFVTSHMGLRISERFFQTDVMSSVEQSGYFILIGLNPNHKGMINGNSADKILASETYERFGDDHTAGNAYLIRRAVGRLKGESALELFRSKFDLLWSTHWQLFQVALHGSNDQEFVRLLGYLDSMIYLLVTFFIAVNVIASILNRSGPVVFAMQLFILGFAIWSLILEAQNRYAIITYPYQILLGTLGMQQLGAFVTARFRRADSAESLH